MLSSSNSSIFTLKILALAVANCYTIHSAHKYFCKGLGSICNLTTADGVGVVPDVSVDGVDAPGDLLDGEREAAVQPHGLAVHRRPAGVQLRHPLERHVRGLLQEHDEIGD